MSSKMVGKVRRARKVDPNGNIYYDRGVSDIIFDPIRGTSVKEDIDKLMAGLETALQFVAANPKGMDGQSAYEIAKEHGFEGTEYEWVQSLKGDPGADGLNAYELAVTFFGFQGTMKDYLDSLKGEQGDTGKSAYQSAVDNGFEGTEEEWVETMFSDAITDEEIVEIYNKLVDGTGAGGDDYQGLASSIDSINQRIGTMDTALQETMTDVQIDNDTNVLTGYKTNGETFQRRVMSIASEADMDEVLKEVDDAREEEGS